MTVYLGQINDFVINKTTPVIHFLSEKLEGFHGNIRPLFFSECEKRGTQLANLLKNPNASEFIATTYIHYLLLCQSTGCPTSFRLDLFSYSHSARAIFF
jgi:hypothetical protein